MGPDGKGEDNLITCPFCEEEFTQKEAEESKAQREAELGAKTEEEKLREKFRDSLQSKSVRILEKIGVVCGTISLMMFFGLLVCAILTKFSETLRQNSWIIVVLGALFPILFFISAFCHNSSYKKEERLFKEFKAKYF